MGLADALLTGTKRAIDDLTGKVALVTGGSRGIGRAIALRGAGRTRGDRQARILRGSILHCSSDEIEATPELFTFVETGVFTRRITALALEEPLWLLQNELLQSPEAGDVDPGTGGLRKVRMADPGRGKGKRGGARVHYLWLEHRRTIYLLYVYSKNESATLSVDDKRQLRALVTQIKAQA